MTPGDVIDLLMRNESLSHADSGEAIRSWGDLVTSVKPGAEWRPLSPPETAKIRAELEKRGRIVRALLAALGDAKARRPEHFYVVSEGGR